MAARRHPNDLLATAMQLAPPFQHHAVLQRDRPIPVWGTTSPHGQVRLEIAGQRARTQADADGRWLLRLPPLPAGGPHTLVATGPDGEARLEDVLIGEVWLCSGQSNMEWSLEATAQDPELPTGSGLDRVRLLTLGTPAQLGRQHRIDGRWRPCDRETLAAFSAVGGWFGRRLHTALDVPIGLIGNAWGGTRVQAWISREALALEPEGRDELAAYDYALHLDTSDGTLPLDIQEWLRRAGPQDTGNRGLEEGWAEPDFDDADWATMELPTSWQRHGHPGSGVFWFRRRVALPAGWASRELQLELGAIDKHDDTYAGGRRVGGLSWETGPDSWRTPREYRVPAGSAAEDGTLTLAVRARSHVYDGGLRGPATAMRIHPVGEAEAAIPLTGAWRYAVEQDWGVVTLPAPPWGPGNPNSPHIQFDSRITPLLPYAIAGAIWYQGESNAAEAGVYRRLLPAMVRDWRRAWGQGDFPFIQVQLANYMQPVAQPARSAWAELRDAQAAAAASEPAVSYAVAIDIGEAEDIHPRDKRSVGERLARIALAESYGLDVVARGPTFRCATIEAGGRIRCRFDHAEALATRDGGPVRGVAIAGEDRCFRWAEATIEGETLVAWHPEIPRPRALRYAWADNPVEANLIGREGLPAAPFRSDPW